MKIMNKVAIKLILCVSLCTYFSTSFADETEELESMYGKSTFGFGEGIDELKSTKMSDAEGYVLKHNMSEKLWLKAQQRLADKKVSKELVQSYLAQKNREANNAWQSKKDSDEVLKHSRKRLNQVAQEQASDKDRLKNYLENEDQHKKDLLNDFYNKIDTEKLEKTMEGVKKDSNESFFKY